MRILYEKFDIVNPHDIQLHINEKRKFSLSLNTHNIHTHTQTSYHKEKF